MFKSHVYYAKPSWFDRVKSNEDAMTALQMACVLGIAFLLGHLVCYLAEVL